MGTDRDRASMAGLRQNSIFEGLTAQQIDLILPCILHAVQTYRQGDCVCNRGDVAQGLGVVLEGQLLICGEKQDWAAPPLAVIGENGLFGEVDAFATQRAMPNRVVAGKETTVLYLSPDFFVSLCNKECHSREAHQMVLKNLLRLLADRSIMLGKKIAYLTASDLKTKIAMYLWELYEVNCSISFHMPLNRVRLAEFFDVARPSLSRELVNLKNQGVIDFHRSQVTILDLDTLHRISLGES